MFIFLLPLVFALSALLALSFSAAPLARCWRQCLLCGALFGGLLLFAGTEFLGFFKILAPGPVALYWLLVCAGIGLAVFQRRERLVGQFSAPSWPPLELTEKLLLASVAVIALLALAQSIIAPPNNWDSMSYHLPRVMHWRQNMCVDFYPTHITRQLHRAPFAEYGLLHLHLLCGSDRFLNLLQWCAMCGSLLGVSLLAGRFGGARKIQLAAALLAATIPSGILEASTTQNDYVCSFFILSFVWMLYGLKRESGLGAYLCAGAALGLAALTKPTAYIFIAPFGLWFLLARLRGRGMLAKTCAALLLAALVNAPHAARNMALYGAPLGPRASAEDFQVESNGSLGVRPLLSNMMRHAALDLNLPSAKEGDLLEGLVRGAHLVIGANPDDPDSTVAASGGFRLPEFSAFEDTTPNPLHLLLVVAVLLWPGFWRRGGLAAAHALLVLAGFALFCLFIKWSPWSTRHHLVVFLLLVPALDARLRGTGTLRFILPVLALASSYWLLCNVRKPVLARHNIFNMPRWEQYLLGRPGNGGNYLAVAELVRKSGCGDIGLVLGPDSWEYPFWLLLSPDGSRRLEHVEVSNISGSLPDSGFEPCFTVRAQTPR
ncbi:MAG: hypothetical protein GX410_01720 [Elusimicrobia bacterium]|nr:hypothetical protein [Elusimicrobiota bacterium]